MKVKKDDNILIGINVKQARENAGLTQEKFAEVIGVSTQYVSDLERGTVGMAITTLKRLCEKLSISSDEIILNKTANNEREAIAEKLRYLPPEQFDFLKTVINEFILTVAIIQK